MKSLHRWIVAASVLSLMSGSVPLAGDPQAAERQYRIARRLAAEGSAEAGAALEKVVTLDPTGDLADDALVDHALLLGAASWPEELGKTAADPSRDTVALLDRVLAQHPGGDRAVEARYLRALSRLQPATGFDASAARLELLDITSRAPGGPWDRRARYTRAWLDERQGNEKPALASYQRLIVDWPGSPDADRARVGRARILLRQGDFAGAARSLQEAIDRGVKDSTAPALRELAVRTLLRRSGRLTDADTFETVVPATGVRILVGMAAYPDGGVLLAGRRVGVLRFGVFGEAEGRWELDQLQAVAVDAQGVAFAAAGDAVYRLDPGAAPRRVAGLGELAPVSGMAVDGVGRFWLLDRRGESVATLQRGGEAPAVVWRDKSRRLSALVSDGSRIVAVDTRDKSVVSLERTGQVSPVASAVGDRPEAVTVDPAGRLAVLDPRAGTVVLTPADRSIFDTVALKAAGIGRPAAIALGSDGRLHVFDSASGAWLRTQ